MMAPTDRSMPAVRIDQRLRSADNADDGDLLQDERQGEGREEAAERQ